MKKISRFISMVLVITLLICFPLDANALYYTSWEVVDHSSYDSFRNSVLGKAFNVDGEWGAQCWDGASILWLKVYGRYIYCGDYQDAYGNWCHSSNAKDTWNLAKDYNAGTEFLPITNPQDICRGDVVVFDGAGTGHIGFADEDYNNNKGTISLLAQNQGSVSGLYWRGEYCTESAFNLYENNKNSILGAFRYTKWSTPKPLDVNVVINGQKFWDGYPGLTFDVYVDDMEHPVKNDVKDYCFEHRTGSQFKIDDFRYKGKPIAVNNPEEMIGWTDPNADRTEVNLDFTFMLDIDMAVGDTLCQNGIKDVTFDLFINGEKVRDDTSDYCEPIMPGYQFAIGDLKWNPMGIPSYLIPSISGIVFIGIDASYNSVNGQSQQFIIKFADWTHIIFGDNPTPAHAPARKSAMATKGTSYNDIKATKTVKSKKVEFRMYGNYLTSPPSSGNYTYASYGGRRYVRPLQYIEPPIPCYLSTNMASTRSDYVAWVQRELKKLGYSNMPVDGYYGYTTANIVRQFQRDYDLPVTGVITTNDVAVIKKPIKKCNPPELKLVTPASIPSGGITTVSWEGVEHAESYNIYVYNSAGELINSNVETRGKTASFVLYDAGEYTIKAVSENERFTSGYAQLSTKVTVYNPRHVQFVDWDGSVLSNQFVEYGKAARTPASPERDGYTFTKWDKDYSAVTAEETVVQAVYSRNQYKVKFLNTNDKELYTDLCYFGESATAPDTSALIIQNGYSFVGWNKDFSNVTEDIVVKPIIEWTNTDIPIIIDNCGATKDSNYGYNVTATIRNYDVGRTNGRLVAALKTADGKFITMSESEAFTLAASGETTLEIFVPCSQTASIVDVYVVNTYHDLIPISESSRIKLNNSTAVSSGEAREIIGSVDASLAGKQAILFVYKIDGASDYTNEFVGQTVIGTDGSYAFYYKLREEPSVLTGDYHIVLGVEGADGVISLGTIKAPKPVYTVEIVDFDGRVISTQNVTDGENAVLPTENPSRPGYTFAGWDYTNTAIHEDMTIRPVYVNKVYTVVFIDWTTERFDMQTYYYGEPLIAPDLSTLDEFDTIGWDGYQEGMTVTENMVITAQYEKKQYTVSFYDENGNLINNQLVDYGASAMCPTCESDGNAFLVWENSDYECVTSDLEIHPVVISSEQASKPQSNLTDTIYNAAVSVKLSAEDGETIWYSLDGETFEEYSGPIRLTETTVIKAYSAAENKMQSEMAEFTYIINKPYDESNWKYPVYIHCADYIEPGLVLADANTAFSLDQIPQILLPENSDGFYEDAGYTVPCEQSFSVTGAKDIYVKSGEYTVTFKDAHDNTIDVQSVGYLGRATEPEMPQMDDELAFAGWDTDEYLLVKSDLTVTAVYKNPLDIDSVKIERSSYNMVEGFTHTMAVEYQGDNAYEVLWTSDDESVAVVDETGKITALNEGETTITATILGTDISDSCIVKVGKNPELSLVPANESRLIIEDGVAKGISPDANSADEITAMIASDKVKVMSGNAEITGSEKAGTGATIILLDAEGNEIDSAVLIINGDVDGNGVVNNADASHLIRHNVGKETLEGPYLKAADTNSDNTVNNRDASKLSRYLVGKESL